MQKNTYKVHKVENGWQIFCHPTGEYGVDLKYPVQPVKIYPFRQNAYAHRKVLDDRDRNRDQYIFTAYAQIKIEHRHDCAAVVKQLRTFATSVAVHDPLFEEENRADLRYVTCALLCRKDEDVHDPDVKPWRRQAPTLATFTDWLEPIKSMPGVTQVDIRFENVPPPLE